MGAVKNHFHDGTEVAKAADADDVMFETSPGHWNDRYNDVFVNRVRGYWTVTQRQAGNRSVVVSRHRNLPIALGSAARVSA